MIPIYFCDDQPAILSELTEMVRRQIQIDDRQFQIRLATTDPLELLRTISSEQGIYFLDVDLGAASLNGFELGKQIRALDPRGFIIYVTTHEELLAETFRYRLEAMDYIFKDQPAELSRKITACLAQIDELLKCDQRETRNHFTVTQGNRRTFVPLEEVIYFETTPKKHVVRLIRKEGHLEFYGNLGEIAASLPDHFIRVHRSFLVNSRHIQGCDRQSKALRLSHQQHCFIARNKLKLVETLISGNSTRQVLT